MTNQPSGSEEMFALFKEDGTFVAASPKRSIASDVWHPEGCHVVSYVRATMYYELVANKQPPGGYQLRPGYTVARIDKIDGADVTIHILHGLLLSEGQIVAAYHYEPFGDHSTLHEEVKCTCVNPTHCECAARERTEMFRASQPERADAIYKRMVDESTRTNTVPPSIAVLCAMRHIEDVKDKEHRRAIIAENGVTRLREENEDLRAKVERLTRDNECLRIERDQYFKNQTKYYKEKDALEIELESVRAAGIILAEQVMSAAGAFAVKTQRKA